MALSVDAITFLQTLSTLDSLQNQPLTLTENEQVVVAATNKTRGFFPLVFQRQSTPKPELPAYETAVKISTSILRTITQGESYIASHQLNIFNIFKNLAFAREVLEKKLSPDQALQIRSIFEATKLKLVEIEDHVEKSVAALEDSFISLDPPSLPEVKDRDDVYVRLQMEKGIKQRNTTADETLKEQSEPYLQANEVDKNQVFTQINKDASRPAEGMSRHSINGVQIDGTIGKDAQAIFDILKKHTGKADQEILKMMTLLQQGIFAGIQSDIMAKLHVGPDTGFEVRAGGQYIRERQQSKNKPIISYSLTADGKNLKVECSIFFELVTSDSDKKAIFREKTPYAIFSGTITVDFNQNSTVQKWGGSTKSPLGTYLLLPGRRTKS